MFLAIFYADSVKFQNTSGSEATKSQTILWFGTIW